MICSDPDKLVQLVLRERGMNPSTSVILTGMDDGQGFCKIGVVFLDTEGDLAEDSRAKYSEVNKTLNLHFSYFLVSGSCTQKF